MTDSGQRGVSPRIDRLVHLLDDAFPIPGTPWRIGLDPILGLLPGAGDALSSALSLALLREAVRLGVPRRVLQRMIFTMLIDYVLGLVPLVGDAGDVFFRANRRNLRLLERHAAGERPMGWSGRAVLLGAALLIAATLALGVWIATRVLGWLLPA